MNATVDRLMSHISRAYKYACKDPETSLIYARKAAEDITKKLFEDSVGRAGKLMLDQLIGKLTESSSVPPAIVAHLRSIQAYGNYAAHSQSEAEVKDALPCLLALNAIVNWFFNDYAKLDMPQGIAEILKTPLDGTEHDVQSLPEFLILPDDTACLLRCRFAQDDDLKAISEIANHFLGEGHGIAEAQAAAWHQRNRTMFRIVETKSANDERWSITGFYSVIAIQETTLDLLRSGLVQDYQIPPSSIACFADSGVKGLYIMDVMARQCISSEKVSPSCVGQHLLKDLIAYVHSLIEENGNLAYVCTIVASDAGRNLVRKSGFTALDTYHNPLGWEFWTMGKEVLRNSSLLGVNDGCLSFQEEYVIER